FQFIKHSKRWLIVSSTLIILSLVIWGVRGLNFGIDFRGGTQWSVQMASGKHASVSEVRDILNKQGFGDANVSILSPPGGGAQTIRVEARVIDDPTVVVQNALAKYGNVSASDVQVPSGTGGDFTFTAKKGTTPTVEGVKAALTGARLTNPQVKVDG